VTVYVPARDEAEIIEACVRALLAEPVSSVVVVDDASTDETPELLAALARTEPRLTVLQGQGPRPGECGKPAALAFAVAQRPPLTPWLLFVDADVVLARGAVAGLLEAAEATGAALVTVIPELELVTPLEKLAMPPIGALILARHPPARVADPGDPLAFANGQVLLVERDRYLREGGHGAVVSEVLEDVRLAERLKRGGARLLVADGQAAARTRMYARWSELVEGWTKNLHLLMGGRQLRSLSVACGVLALGLAPWLVLALSPDALGVWGYLAILAMQMLLRRSGKASPLWAVLAPLGGALTAWILLRSARRHRRGSVVWKGRRYGV
jgi:hypothetical protein